MRLVACICVCLLLQSGSVRSFCPVVGPRQTPQYNVLYVKKTVFIDGEAGTTGIQVRDRLGKRDDIEILSIPDSLRKDDAARKEYINKADAVILCTLAGCHEFPLF
jgi:hypothetical protein